MTLKGEQVTGRETVSRDTARLGEVAQEALISRPRLSLRARIAAVFILLFTLMTGVTVTTMALLHRLDSKYEFLDDLEKCAFHIQEARRYEKNFFLYGTDISDALAHLHTSRNEFDRATEHNGRGFKAAAKRVRDDLDRYEGLLERLLATSGASDRTAAEQRKLQAELRKHGTQLHTEIHHLVERERLAVYSMLQTMTWTEIFFLLLMFFLMLSAAGYISRAVIRPLRRFVEYAARIGKGDYSPITPVRKYRDEFTELGMAVNHMISELKDRLEELTQTKKMAAIGSLTSGIAHELNNPLNNIGMTTEALLEDYDDYPDEKKRQMLEQIYTQVERASSTVRNLLDFTRKEQPAFTSLDVAEVVHTTAKLAGNELNLAGIDLELELADDLPSVMGNPRNLQQVFLNLFLNAIQAMEHGGKLVVRSKREGGFIRVDVSDSGVGIPKENIDKVFDPFFTTKETGEGTGLGLSVSFGVIEKHKGKITVASEVGEGTTFSVFLPTKQGS